MVAIEAHRGSTYSFDLFLAPLSKVANVEKKFLWNGFWTATALMSGSLTTQCR